MKDFRHEWDVVPRTQFSKMFSAVLLRMNLREQKGRWEDNQVRDGGRRGEEAAAVLPGPRDWKDSPGRGEVQAHLRGSPGPAG